MVRPVDVTVRKDLELAVDELRRTGASHVFVRNGAIVASGTGPGVLSLVRTVDRVGSEALSGSVLADKVVGKAALMIALACGVRAVHGEFMSEAAIEGCRRYGVPFTYGAAIPKVLNQAGTDYCPFEVMVGELDDPHKAFELLQDAARRSAAPQTPPSRPRGSRGAATSGTGRLRSSLRMLAESGLWLAGAVLLPVALHPLGAGPVLLPMHLPVLLAAAFTGPLLAGSVGLLAPMLSHVLTGMPPLVPPVAPLMSVELGAYGVVGGWLHRRLCAVPSSPGSPGCRFWISEYAWLLGTMAAGRLALGVAAQTLGPVLGLRMPGWTYVVGAVVSGLPGILVQLVVVPVAVGRLSRLKAARLLAA